MIRLVDASLNFRPPVTPPRPKWLSSAADQRAADAAGVVGGDLHRRASSRSRPPASGPCRCWTRRAARRPRPASAPADVLHRHAALDDVEAAGVLHHHAHQLLGRAELVRRQVAPAAVRLGHGQHAQLVAALLDVEASAAAAAPAASSRGNAAASSAWTSWRFLSCERLLRWAARARRARETAAKLCHPAPPPALPREGDILGLDGLRPIVTSIRHDAPWGFPGPEPHTRRRARSARPPSSTLAASHRHPRPARPPCAPSSSDPDRVQRWAIAVALAALAWRCSGRCGRGSAPRSRSCSSCRRSSPPPRAAGRAAGLFVTGVGFSSALLWLLPPGRWWVAGHHRQPLAADLRAARRAAGHRRARACA